MGVELRETNRSFKLVNPRTPSTGREFQLRRVVVHHAGVGLDLPCHFTCASGLRRNSITTEYRGVERLHGPVYVDL
jgi:hypothetical protein